MTDSSSAPRHALHVDLPTISPVRQIDGLQILRAAAVAIVAWGHAGLFYTDTQRHHLPDMGVFGIDIFFVLSGFILMLIVLRSPREPGLTTAWRFFLRRLVRIFPIYWVFSAISIAILVHRHEFRPAYLTGIFLLPYPQYPFMPIIVDFTWTLVYEMFFYLLLSLIQVVTVRRAGQALIALLVALVALRLVVSIRQPVLIVAANPMLLEFAFGAAIAMAYCRWGRRRGVGIGLAIAGVGAAFFFLAMKVASPIQQMILFDQQVLFRVGTWGVAAGAIVAGTVFWEPDTRGWLAKIAVVLGNASYSAYLASALTIYLLSRAVHGVLPHGVAGSVPLRICCQALSVVAVLAAGWASYQWLEWPMLRRLQKALQ